MRERERERRSACSRVSKTLLLRESHGLNENEGDRCRPRRHQSGAPPVTVSQRAISSRTRRGPFVVRHRIGHQGTRYEVDQTHEARLQTELQSGRRRVEPHHVPLCLRVEGAGGVLATAALGGVWLWGGVLAPGAPRLQATFQPFHLLRPALLHLIMSACLSMMLSWSAVGRHGLGCSFRELRAGRGGLCCPGTRC